MAGYDLHMHSIYSDGSLTPSQLVEEAVGLGLDGMALTDHDNVDGISEAVAAAGQFGLCFVPGVEITTDYGDKEAHILGYQIDYHHPALREKFEIVLAARTKRAQQMIEKLKRHGVAISWEQVQARSKTRFIGRPHIFRTMEELNLVDPLRRRDYFEYYLGQHGLAYVPHQEIETGEAIELILAAGGIPVLAHPGRSGTEEFIGKLITVGLQGLEVYYPSHTPEMIVHFLDLVNRYHLYITGGSDYHGDLRRTTMGAAVVTELGWECRSNQ